MRQDSVTFHRLLNGNGKVMHQPFETPTSPSAWQGHSLSVRVKASEVPGHRGKNTEWKSPRPLVLTAV